MILTIDTFAWIEAFRGGAAGRRARDAMEAAAECLTPSIVLAEVAAKCLGDGLPEALARNQLQAIREASEVVPIDDSLAITAARATQELRQMAERRHIRPPGLADGLVLATARRANGRLLTGDEHFHACEETIWLG